MNVYTLTKDSSVLGEKDKDYGFTYWIEAEESDLPLKFSTHEMNFTVGQKIVAEDAEKRTSKKGTEYIQLKKVKKVSGSQSSPHLEPETQVAQPQPAAGFTKEDRDKLDLILKYVEPLDLDEVDGSN